MARFAYRKWRKISVLILPLALLIGTGTPASAVAIATDGSVASVGSPPRAKGYFTTLSVGSWSSLPSGRRCADLIHRSSWEPRPDNAGANSRMPRARSVRAAFAARPVALENAYHPRWDTWL